MKYEVKVTRTDVFIYEVEADSEEEALNDAVELNINAEDDNEGFNHCEDRGAEIIP